MVCVVSVCARVCECVCTPACVSAHCIFSERGTEGERGVQVVEEEEEKSLIQLRLL